ncbi:MAG: hypothetical protein ISS41_00805 [Candidatus Aminicenantes bacterium]|nr:hypothetical protein [Candidatus Aminicenantes bacterium]MBL7082150.1 hypothetical protein [Candidatus Aminicenantes bacterium]
MFRKLFFKELREKVNILIFFTINMLIFALIYLFYPRAKSELLEYLYLAMILVVFPLTSVLLGSSAFFSEFKDDSWTYLFSRPIKKWKIWFIKYLSQTIIFFSTLLILLSTILIFPRLKVVIAGFNNTIDFPGVSSLFFSFLVIAFILFTISFSISFLYEKQFIIIFVSISITIGLILAWDMYITFLKILRGSTGIGLFASFIWLSFILASVITFLKTDFSQAWKKIWKFSKSALLFLALSFIFLSTGTFSFIKSSYKYLPYSSDAYHEYKGNFYFDTDKGIFRYLPEKEKLDKIINSKLHLPFNSQDLYSVRGGKIAFLQYVDWKYEKEELWIMNTDGSQKKRLIESGIKKDSPFYNASIYSCVLSKDGKEIVFITRAYIGETYNIIYTLWRMNSDGTGLKSRGLRFPGNPSFRLIEWSESDNSLIFLLSMMRPQKIVKYDLKNEKYKILADSLNRPRELRISPKQDFLAFQYYENNTEEQTLSLLNLQTFEKKEVHKASSIEGYKWSKNGDKIVFIANKNELQAYDLQEDKVRKVKLIYDRIRWRRLNFDFVLNDQKFVVVDVINGESHLVMISKQLKEEKSIKIPFRTKYGIRYILGINNTVLVENPDKDELWLVNLDTENWRKIYH